MDWFITLGNPESPGYDLTGIQSSFRYPRLMIVDTHRFSAAISKQPNTDLLYQLGSFTYQRFHLSHRQGIRKNVAAVVNVRRSKSTGAFQRMTSEFTKLRAGISLISEDSLSQVDVLYHYHRAFAEENGGLEYPEDFEQYLFDIPQLYSVNLSSASNAYKSNHFEGNGKVRLVNRDKGTVNLDLSAKVGRDRSDFVDNAFPIDFYPSIYFDSLTTTDSIVIGWMDNYAGLSIRGENLHFGIGATHYYEDYSQNRKIDTIYHNYGIKGEVQYVSNKVRGTLSGKYIATGYNKGNHCVNLTVNLAIDSGITVYARSGHQSYTPHFGILNRRTNNSFWEFSSYKLPTEISLEGGLEVDRALQANLNVSAQQVTNHLYYNSNRSLAQFQSAVSILGTSLTLRYDVFKYLSIQPSIRYQAVSNNSILPLPDILASMNIGFKRPILKNRLKAEIGARVWWVNEYNGYGYAPELGAFHVQDNVKSGGYPFVHGYANLYVKRATIGVRVNHATEGLLGYDFDLISAYPAQPRQVALHLRWTLID